MLGRYASLGPLATPGAADHAAVAEALERCDVTGLADRSIDALSGGEWQRVRLARALAQEPRILVLDEPTTSLDVRHEMELFELVRRLVDDGLAGLVITHHINLAARFADRMILLEPGPHRGRGHAGRGPAPRHPARGLRLAGRSHGVEGWLSPGSAAPVPRGVTFAMHRLIPMALAAGLLVGCADTNAPPPEPLELLLVVNRQANSLTIVPVDEPTAPVDVSLGPTRRHADDRRGEGRHCGRATRHRRRHRGSGADRPRAGPPDPAARRFRRNGCGDAERLDRLRRQSGPQQHLSCQRLLARDGRDPGRCNPRPLRSPADGCSSSTPTWTRTASPPGRAGSRSSIRRPTPLPPASTRSRSPVPAMPRSRRWAATGSSTS